MPSLNFWSSALSACALVVPRVTTTLRALQIAKVAPDGPDRNHDLGAADKDHGREIDELAALQIVSGGAAFKIDRIIDDRLQPGFRRDLDEIDLEIFAIEQAPDLLHDGIADVDRVADRPPGSIEIGERNRSVAVAEPHRAGRLDPGKGAGHDARVVRLDLSVAGRSADGCGGDDDADTKRGRN